MITKLRFCTNILRQNLKKCYIGSHHRLYCNVIEIIDERSFKFTEVPVNRIRNFSIMLEPIKYRNVLNSKLVKC